MFRTNCCFTSGIGDVSKKGGCSFVELRNSLGFLRGSLTESVMKPKNKCAYTSSPSERILCLQPKIFENKCAIACIEETVYWTELANQAQNTIHYMV